MMRWLRRFFAPPSVMIRIRLRGLDEDIGPYWIADGDAIEFSDESGFRGLILVGKAERRWLDNPWQPGGQA